VKIEDQVVSQEIGQKMEKLGFKQESLFHWYSFLDCLKELVIRVDIHPPDWSVAKDVKKLCSAYTVAELGEILPDSIGYYKSEGNRKGGNLWRVAVDTARLIYANTGKAGNPYNPVSLYANTEANARGKMAIYLKEKGLNE